MTESDEPLVTDRRRLTQLSVGKTTRWPRTDRREARIRAVAARRQVDLAVVLEDVADPHNVAAVLRSCDATGVHAVHLVYAKQEPPEQAYSRVSSASAAKWLELERHESIEVCYAALRAKQFSILASALGERDAQLYDHDFTQPTALVFGNEHRGLSAEAVNAADGAFHIPMAGMVESLNISVACAVSLFEVYRQRLTAGLYDGAAHSEELTEAMVKDWLRR